MKFNTENKEKEQNKLQKSQRTNEEHNLMK